MSESKKWTRFMDMNSGGRLKESHEYILIEAPIEEAKVIFYNKFGHNPERVSCTCCGEDYSIDEHDTIEEATKFDRSDHSILRPAEEKVSLEEFMADPEKLGYRIIRSDEIEPHERVGDVPEQGFVWKD